MERMVEPMYQRVMQRTVMVHYQVHTAVSTAHCYHVAATQPAVEITTFKRLIHPNKQTLPVVLNVTNSRTAHKYKLHIVR
jgi:L-alanine-DL-glutamate epimerase-like enolase superfamily enzyme